jgi:2-succinyl-6-hydroxy-2,4-cyclohexadiene-1-carboxylate synthase
VSGRPGEGNAALPCVEAERRAEPIHSEHGVAAGPLSVERRIDADPLACERRSQGPALMLLHGFTGSGRGMMESVQSLEPEYETIAPDLPGHGRSTARADLSFNATVAALLATLVACGHERAHWLGYSMGARLALACAVHSPASVASLVLVSGRAGIADPAEREARRRNDEELAARIEATRSEPSGLETFVDEWMAQPLFASQQRLGAEFLARARAERLANDANGLAGALRNLGPGAQPPLFERLGDLDLPVLLVAGALDRPFVAGAHDLARRLPRAEVCEIADAGHAVYLEQPDAFACVVCNFLRGADGLAPTLTPTSAQEAVS